MPEGLRLLYVVFDFPQKRAGSPGHGLWGDPETPLGDGAVPCTHAEVGEIEHVGRMVRPEGQELYAAFGKPRAKAHSFFDTR